MRFNNTRVRNDAFIPHWRRRTCERALCQKFNTRKAARVSVYSSATNCELRRFIVSRCFDKEDSQCYLTLVSVLRVT